MLRLLLDLLPKADGLELACPLRLSDGTELDSRVPHTPSPEAPKRDGALWLDGMSEARSLDRRSPACGLSGGRIRPPKTSVINNGYYHAYIEF